MHPAWYLPALALFLSVGFASSEEKKEVPPIPKDKWDATYLDKEWGIKLKSVTFNPEKNGNVYGPYKLLVEFSKDVEDVKALKMGFGGDDGKTAKAFLIYFFDADNVVVHKTTSKYIGGELTGKKGDAFRMYVEMELPWVAEARKAEFRANK